MWLSRRYTGGMIRTLLALSLLHLPLYAQFDNLVTTDDGSTVLFQSQWRFAGSSDGNQSKVFRWDAQGFASFSAPPNLQPASPPTAFNPIISGDGSITGYISYTGCAGGAACFYTPYLQVSSGPALPPTFPLSPLLQISRDGRYVASGTTVLDRNSGTMQVVGAGDPTLSNALPIGGRFGIGNNGGMLVLVLHRMFIISTVDLVLSDQPGTVIVNTSAVYTAIVSAAENRVVYEIPAPSGQTAHQLWSYDMASRQANLLETFDFGSYVSVSQYQPAISNDGMRLAYRRINPTTRQWEAVVRDFSAGTTKVVGTMLASQNNFSITGDGKSVWLHRSDGRLVRIDIDSLTATETTGRHAWVTQREGAPAYGSYNHLFGGGFSTGGLPTDLTVDLSGLTCPILSAGTQEMDIEIPWEAYLGEFTFTLRNSSSPFESVLPVYLVTLTPTFERSGMPNDANRQIILAHQDFHGPVTFSDPAAGGETLHLYMTGLGDVQPRPATGQAPSMVAFASQRPQCWVTSPIAPAQTGVPVLFAGIAPGMIGMYQVDITIPASPASTVMTLGCVQQGLSGGLAGDYGSFPVVTGK